jgi:hypothetical protein
LPGIGEFLLKIVVIPCAVAAFGAYLIIRVLNVIEPPITRAWRRSAFRAWFYSQSKAQCCLLAGLIGNALEVLLCLPFLRIPPGTAIKPMGHPLMIIVIAAVTIATAGGVSKNPERPDGPRWLQFIAGPLCVTPLFVGFTCFLGFAALRGLEFG